MNKPVTYTPPGGEPKKKRDPVARFWLSLLRAALVIGLILYILRDDEDRAGGSVYP